MQEQTFRPDGVVGVGTRILVGLDVEIQELHFALVDERVAFADAAAAVADGLHLGAAKLDARLEMLEDKVVAQGLAVGRDDFDGG